MTAPHSPHPEHRRLPLAPVERVHLFLRGATQRSRTDPRDLGPSHRRVERTPIPPPRSLVVAGSEDSAR